MKSPLSLIAVLLAFALILPHHAALADTEPPPDAASEPPRGDVERMQRVVAKKEGLFNVDFEGGSVAEYVEALREALPEINVVLRPRVDEFQVVPVRLRNVHEHSAVMLLQTAATHPHGPYARIMITSIEGPVGQQVHRGGGLHTPERTGHTVYVVRPRGALPPAPDEAPKPSPPETETHAISVAHLLHDGVISPAAMLSAIEAGLEMLSPEQRADPPVRIRFHEDTQLLIVRGTSREVREINEVLRELSMTVSVKRPEDEAVRLQAEIDRLLARIAELEAELARARRSRSQPQD